MNDAFISYARQDTEIAQSVSSLLQKLGVTTFFDMNDLIMGMEYATVVTNAIRTCRVFVAIVSESSVNSQWCLKELDEAFNNKKPIVCINIGKIDQLRIPYDLEVLRFIDYDALLENPQQLLQIINQSGVHKGDSATSILPKIESSNEQYYNETKTYKPRKSAKTWLKWSAVIITILVISGVLLFVRTVSFDVVHPCSPEDSNSDTSTLVISRHEYRVLKRMEYQRNTIQELKEEIKRFRISMLCVSIIALVLIIILVFLKRKIKHLTTDLGITSDAKIQAKVGDDSLMIEKGDKTSLVLPVGMQRIDLNYTAFNSPKRINCFIAGATALQTERDALRATISLVCNRWKEKNFQIFSFTFEDFERKFAPNGQQSLYDYFIENEANVAIFLIKGEVGNFTITEFEKAYKSFKTSKHPSIIVYYDRSSELSTSAIELKNRVLSIGQYWVDYNTLNEMKYHFQEVLSTDLWTLYEKELSAK